MDNGSPVEEGEVSDAFGLVDETDTVLGEGILKLVKGVERAVDNGFIREMPKMLSRLEFRPIGWEEKGLESRG
jgi:hypothetical protein